MPWTAKDASHKTGHANTPKRKRLWAAIANKQLAAWAAILAVPTAVAGIDGMNFDVIPELHWQYGYALVLVFIALICGMLYLRFRRSGWL